jgi:quercetin dioxygenase-like cupin family protein
MRIACAVVLASACANAQSEWLPQSAAVKVVKEQVIPGMDGTKLKTTILEVSYAPGGSSAAHRHPCPVIGYVLEGRYRTQIGDGPVTIYQKGETFYEPPNGVHQVSANASPTEPVRFLAYFLCDSDARLSTPAN